MISSPGAIALDLWMVDFLQALQALNPGGLTPVQRDLQRQVLARLGWELLIRLQAAGILMAPDQYDQLQQALEHGFGQQGWQSFKRLCRLLWLKPSPAGNETVFERVVEQFRQDHPPELLIPNPPIVQEDEVEHPRRLPRIPPRRLRSQPLPDEQKVPAALQGHISTPDEPAKPKRPERFCFLPQRFPVSARDVQTAWKQLREQTPQQSQRYELDLEATISRLLEEGALTDVVLKPEQRSQVKLLVLVDDENVMLPYQAALQPFIQTIIQNRYPAQFFRFNSYPSQYLYPYQSSRRPQDIADVLSRLHRFQTIAIIWSEGGAALRSGDPERIDGMIRFLVRLAPCVRQLIWLNPLPEERWQQSVSAWRIAQVLNGQMYCFNGGAFQQIAHQRQMEVKLQP